MVSLGVFFFFFFFKLFQKTEKGTSIFWAYLYSIFDKPELCREAGFSHRKPHGCPGPELWVGLVPAVLEMTLLVPLEAGPLLWASYHCVPATAQLHFLHRAGQLVSQSAGHLGLCESWARFCKMLTSGLHGWQPFCAWPASLSLG